MGLPFVAYFKRIDAYGSGVNFTFDGRSSYQSVCGAILTIIVFTLALFQLSEKSQILVNKEDTNYSERVVFGANNVDENSIGYKETGYNFAFGIVTTNFVEESGRGVSDTEILNYLELGVYK